MPRDIFSCHNSEVGGGGRATDIEGVEARNLANHLRVRSKCFLAQNVNSAEIEKPHKI